jgi:5-methyltetrahydropteroyltriglutamate--homocysteine methyltransferase
VPCLVKPQSLMYNRDLDEKTGDLHRNAFMTQLLIANIGSYPRIGEEKDQQRHRRGLGNFQNQDISAHAFRDVEQSVIQEVVREQISVGMDEVTDGLVAWADPISHLCGKLSGVKITGLLRYFDTNFYYRVPVIESKPKRKSSLLLSEFQYARDISNKPIRMVLTGPLTLATHTTSTLSPYNKPLGRAAFFSELLLEEIKELVSHGAKYIQIDEPALPQHRDAIGVVQKFLEQIRSIPGLNRLILNINFSPLATFYERLAALPVDVLNLDFTYDGKPLMEKILSSKPKTVALGLGLLNARNTKIEAIDPMLHFLRQWIEKSNPALCYVTPSAGLEFLPREQAFAKIRLLAKIREESLPWLSKIATHV